MQAAASAAQQPVAAPVSSPRRLQPAASAGACCRRAPAVVPPAPSGVPLPPGYVIGPDDVLSVVFWRDKDMSADVAVRPDGKITLPLVNDIQAAGKTPEQLRAAITRGGRRGSSKTPLSRWS